MLVLFSIAIHKAESKIINITVADFSFSPSSVTVFVGDTVKWTWIGARTHTTTCDGVFPGTVLPGGASPWDMILDGGNPVFEYAVNVEGTYEYVCRFHAPDMAGTIIAEHTLPVELTDFVATTIKNEVILDWSTGGEFNNDKFEIQRIAIDNNTDFNPDDLPFVTIATLFGNGTSSDMHDYRYHDRNLTSGTYMYRLKQIDYNNNFVYHLLNTEVVIGIPSKFGISQNYPNPFNPSTKINYEIPTGGLVSIKIYDYLGKEVMNLSDGYTDAGYHIIEFNGSNLSSGAYIYKIDFESEGKVMSMSKRMVLIK